MATSSSVDNSYENQFLSATVNGLYLSSKLADIYFVFGGKSRRRVPAHKCLLAAASDVFKKRFYGKKSRKDDVKIKDVSVAAFKQFLQFFYRSKVNLTMENVSDVLMLGEKYNVTACLKICEQFLTYNLTNDNACFCFGIATLYDLNDLKKMCESTIASNTKSPIDSMCYLECDRSVLCRLLKSQQLSSLKSMWIEACIVWIQAKTKQEHVSKELIHAHFGELFHTTHFASMAFEEFVAASSSYGHLFTQEQYREIVEMIERENFHTKMFKKTTHAAMPDGRFDVFSSKSIQTISFITQKPVVLDELLFTTLILDENNQSSPEMSVIEISHDGTPKVLYDEKVKISSKRIVSLSRPIFIKIGFMYNIHWKQSTESHIYHRRSLKNKTKYRK